LPCIGKKSTGEFSTKNHQTVSLPDFWAVFSPQNRYDARRVWKQAGKSPHSKLTI